MHHLSTTILGIFLEQSQGKALVENPSIDGVLYDYFSLLDLASWRLDVIESSWKILKKCNYDI